MEAAAAARLAVRRVPLRTPRRLPLPLVSYIANSLGNDAEVRRVSFERRALLGIVLALAFALLLGGLYGAG